MGKAGRPRLSGPRKKNGKRELKPAWDYGNPRVIARRARFARYRNDDKAADQLADPIGRAWAVGLLENDRIDPAVLRDAGRKYAAWYWSHYPTTPGVANYTCEARRGTASGQTEDERGLRFNALDRALAGFKMRRAVHELCVDRHWFPDADPAWLDRLIRNKLGKCIVARTDVLTLRLAIDGLMALAGEKERIAA